MPPPMTTAVLASFVDNMFTPERQHDAGSVIQAISKFNSFGMFTALI